MDFGSQGMVAILTNLVCIALSWKALQAIRLDAIIKKNHVLEARLLYILAAIALGSLVANFFLDYLFWSKQLIEISK